MVGLAACLSREWKMPNTGLVHVNGSVLSPSPLSPYPTLFPFFILQIDALPGRQMIVLQNYDIQIAFIAKTKTKFVS